MPRKDKQLFLASKEVSSTDKLLFIAILSQGETTTKTNRELAKIIGSNYQTVSDGIGRLVKMKLLNRRLENGYRILEPRVWGKEISFSTILYYKYTSYINNPIVTDFKKSDDLIDFWNSLSNTRKHHDQSKKVYKDSAKLLSQLRRGQLASKNNLNGQAKHANKKFTDAEIKKGMLLINDMLTPGFEPKNKSHIKNLSLAQFIYNPYSNLSYFLAVLENPPKSLTVDPALDKSYGKYLKYITYPKSNRGMALKQLAKLKKRYDGIEPDEYGNWEYHCGKFKDFLESYSKYLESRYDPDKYLLIGKKTEEFLSWWSDEFTDGLWSA